MSGTSCVLNAVYSSSSKRTYDVDTVVDTVEDLARLCGRLGAASVGTLSDCERDLIPAGGVSESLLRVVREKIETGQDPLGSMYCQIRSRVERRPLGQTYTPAPVVQAMVDWASSQGTPSRIIDPGAGSGRYLLAAAQAFPNATGIAVEVDPLSALMLRANVAVLGLSKRIAVHLGDYRTLTVESVEGSTLFVGNPPYVRHHAISSEWKKWLTISARERGFKASALAGLHVYFFLATARLGKPGDFGAFITSSEWLDVNYGSLVRQLLLDGLGGDSVHVIDPKLELFDDAMTTGAITCFKVGDAPSSMRLRRVDRVNDLGNLSGGRKVSRQRLAESNRWSVLSRVTPKLPEGYIELGELCRVHRGQVTGANQIWVQRRDAVALPDRVLYPSVTRARELFKAGDRIDTSSGLRVVIDLPVDLDEFDDGDRIQIDRFLQVAKTKKADEGYIASKRRAWWSVGLRSAAPLLATYMARRPPAFVRNGAQVRHINIAHGLYPREPLSNSVLDNLGSYLRTAVSVNQGRTYAGGLTKFEPKEMERIVVPDLGTLTQECYESGVSAKLES
ncbi:modification methylase XamI [Nocardia nova SH22a]|uniref:site-specific DNA-methyltransferase (adenine-specific) n=1 Tax=Nocardia nova SH22a TaxID=1415166 RepID=W5TM58_9NOCA|nr:N-6 DNA methylase [Nocardia nova]AHH20224.1 modification methylase XamI [Nocardia nova SH22a]